MADEQERAGRLVIERHSGQGLYVGRDIRIRVVRVQDGGRVDLMIEAPQTVAVTRDEFSMEEHMQWQEHRERGGRPRRRP